LKAVLQNVTIEYVIQRFNDSNLHHNQNEAE